MTKEEVSKELCTKVDTAIRLLKECVKLSDESGVPFSFHFGSVASNCYIPKTAKKVALDPEYPDDESYVGADGEEIYDEYDAASYGGWTQSVC